MNDGIMTVTIRCPATGKPIDTKITMDQQTFARTVVGPHCTVTCPYCHESHLWTKQDASLTAQPVGGSTV